jgi:hypothetical protein
VRDRDGELGVRSPVVGPLTLMLGRVARTYRTELLAAFATFSMLCPIAGRPP